MPAKKKPPEKATLKIHPVPRSASPAVPVPSEIPTDAAKNSQIINSNVT